KHGPLHNLHAYGTLRHVQYTGTFRGPTTGGTVYLGDRFPPAMRDAFIGGNFLGHSVSWWRVVPHLSTVQATLGGNLLDARDTWFGPTDVCLGPDGAIYVCDFYDQRTAHPDPDARWDRSNGRVYKIVAAEADTSAASASEDLAARTSEQLVDLLRGENGWRADQARSFLAARRDASIVPRLAQLALDTTDERIALQYTWALYVSGGWDESRAAALLDHPAEYVRKWTVRLLGDSRAVSSGIARQLVELARRESSPVVRAQLAASARRLAPQTGLPIVTELLDRDADANDPFVPMLLWWAVEDKALSASTSVLALATRPGVWQSALWRHILPRLARRYAAAGTDASYGHCLQLLAGVPADRLDGVLSEVSLGLDERARQLEGMGTGDLYQARAAAAQPAGPSSGRAFAELPATFRDRVAAFWSTEPSSEARLRLALQASVPEASHAARTAVRDPATPEVKRLMYLKLLAAYGEAEVLNDVLPLIGTAQPPAVQQAALTVAGRFFLSPEITRQLLAVYPHVVPPVQSAMRDLLLGRAGSARAFLALVEAGQVSPDSIPLEQLRIVALHGDEELNRIVRTYWGNVGPGTPEEKLAEMRRLSNDLRAGSGDATRGKAVFQKHCATCHRRHGEGGQVGPDLTPVARDQEFLLTSLVDPSVVIRSQFLAYAVTTRAGQVVIGTMTQQDAGTITLLDAKAQPHVLPRDAIDEIQELPTSLMPENLLQPLSPQELRDLFRFLLQPS
ncbi:MAG: c-type cytochrome, partial [Pirellulaceae bacterium]